MKTKAVCLVIIAIAIRGMWPTVMVFLHTFPAWFWSDVGWATPFFLLALFVAICYGVAGVWKVREAIQRRHR